MGHEFRTHRPAGERCWPCAVINLAAGLLVAMVPVVAAAAGGDGLAVAAATVWAVAAASFTVHRVVTRGYLPGADVVAGALRLDRVLGLGGSSPPDVD